MSELDAVEAMLEFTSLLERVDGRLAGVEHQLKEQNAIQGRMMRTWARLERQDKQIEKDVEEEKKRLRWHCKKSKSCAMNWICLKRRWPRRRATWPNGWPESKRGFRGM